MDKKEEQKKEGQKEKKIDSKVLGLIWSLIRPHKLKLVFSIIILLLSKGLIVFVPVGIKFGIDIIQSNPVSFSFMDYNLFHFTDISLFHIAYVMLFILFFQYGATYFQIYLTNSFGLKMMSGLREKLFAHVLGQSFSFYNKSRTGLLLTRIVHDIQTLNELFVTGIPTIFGDLFLIVSIVILSFFIDVKLTLVSLFTFPFLYIGMMIFKKHSRRSFLQIRGKLARLNEFLQSSISGIKIVQVFNRQNKIFRIFSRLQKDYFLEYIRTVRIYAYYFPLVESFSVLSRVFIILFGTYWVYSGTTSLSSVIAFLFFSPMFFDPLRELSEQYNVLQSAMASGEKIFGLLSTNEAIKDGNYSPATTKDLRKGSNSVGIVGNISFRNVSFSYNEDHLVLDNVSFDIKAGEKFALVGLTGSGKTTIVNLLSRLYDTYEGDILLDGVSIRDYKKDELRGAISYMLQDIFIFSKSIRENIRLFDDSIADEEIYEVARKVRADSFIRKLENSYDTILGERGVGISFGEKQLLSFARVLIQRSRIIVFDEATSNIDTKTEGIIQDYIGEFLKGKTAIVIAHRLSTIKAMDKIIVLHKGKIKEVGTHRELIKKDSLYKKLYSFQFQHKKSVGF